MCFDVSQVASNLTTVLSSLAAIFSGACAFLSYKLAASIRDELKSDERIVAGVPIHPELRAHEHSSAVIQCTLFNKSKRKAFINAVVAYDCKATVLEITWSDEIDLLGNPQSPCQLVGIVDSCSLFVRRNDGAALDYVRLEISHSFPNSPTTLIFDPTAAWGE